MSTKDRLEGIATAVFGRREAPDELAGPRDDLAGETPTTNQWGFPLAGLDLDTAIRLRWALRDIKAKRTKLTPVSPDDLNTLTELGLVELRDDGHGLTNRGHQLLDQ